MDCRRSTTSPARHRKRSWCFRTNEVCATVVLAGLLLRAQVSVGSSKSKGYDQDITLFSPEGRLYQVEYAQKAVDHYGSPCVGVQGSGCCVVATRKNLQDGFVYPESVTNIHRITDDVFCAGSGIVGDVRYQVKKTRKQALDYHRSYGCPIPSSLLALRMADAAQVYTQHAAMRPMGTVALLLSVDEPFGPCLHKVEPSGQTFQAWATAAGKGTGESMELLEEELKAGMEKASVGGESWDGFGGEEESVCLALRALAKADVLQASSIQGGGDGGTHGDGGGLTERNVEVAVATSKPSCSVPTAGVHGSPGKIRLLSPSEIKHYLDKL